jgi:hypothetical protein
MVHFHDVSQSASSDGAEASPKMGSLTIHPASLAATKRFSNIWTSSLTSGCGEEAPESEAMN